MLTCLITNLKNPVEILVGKFFQPLIMHLKAFAYFKIIDLPCKHHNIFIFNSPETKVQVRCSDRMLSFHLKTFLFIFLLFTKTTRPNLNKLSTNSNRKGILDFEIKPFLKESNCNTVSIECVSLKILFSKTTAPEMPKFVEKLVYVVKILHCKNRGPLKKMWPHLGFKF